MLHLTNTKLLYGSIVDKNSWMKTLKMDTWVIQYWRMPCAHHGSNYSKI